MDDVIYNPPELKEAAYALAEATPRLGNNLTTPPIRWREDAGLLRVLLADGRTFRGPLPVKKAKVQAPKLMPAPVPQVQVELSPRILEPGIPPANLTCASTTGAGKANGKRSPAKHKAGK
jgi:hypothetical protein